MQLSLLALLPDCGDKKHQACKIRNNLPRGRFSGPGGSSGTRCPWAGGSWRPAQRRSCCLPTRCSGEAAVAQQGMGRRWRTADETESVFATAPDPRLTPYHSNMLIADNNIKNIVTNILGQCLENQLISRVIFNTKLWF